MTPRSLSISTLATLLIVPLPVHADWSTLFDDIRSTVTSSPTALITPQSTTSLNNNIVSGLKEALTIGANDAVAIVSKHNGYLSNNLIRISMPPQLKQVSGILRGVGLSSMAENVEQSMNHAAEKAAPEATHILVDAIKNMTIEDANTILKGSDSAATDFFKQKTSEKLTALFEPIINQSLNDVGTTRYYNELVKKIADVPLVGENIMIDLPDYVTNEALNGLFTLIAIEEREIRQNPKARTSDLLKSVFGSK